LREAFPRVARVGDSTTTCSIGLATFEHAPDSVEALLGAADALMYEAKTAGKDKVRHAVVPAAAQSTAHGRLLPFSPASRA
jgi:PleD family two-component response regulator